MNETNFTKANGNTSASSSSGFQKLRILLVEDSMTNQRVAMGILRRLAFEVDVASNGFEAVQALRNNHYHLVLMDILMPEMDGYEATRIIRDPATEGVNHHIPIIALTAQIDAETVTKCMEAGMDDYLAKPLIVQKLKTALSRWENLDSITGEPAMVIRAGVEENPNVDPDTNKDLLMKDIYDPDRLMQRLMGNTQIVNEILESYIEEMPALIKEMHRALQEEDTRSVEIASHSIKSASDYITAHRIQQAAKKAEDLAHHETLEEIPDVLEQIEHHFEVFKKRAKQM